MDEEIYGDCAAQGSVTRELNQYLGNMLKDFDQEILSFWKEQASTFVDSAQMARTYLSIPATSAPSKWVLSKAQAVLNSQWSSLSSCMLKVLFCLKDWFQAFGSIYTSKYLTRIYHREALTILV